MFPQFPKSVYVIFPHDDSGEIAGVYVGSSGNAFERLKMHLHDNQTQKELHDLMRRNGFDWFVVDVIKNRTDLHLEYDWMDFFKQNTHLHLFNQRTQYHKPDWRRIGGEKWLLSSTC
jgi:hypothetical protein